jgi:hypothetical protein
MFNLVNVYIERKQIRGFCLLEVSDFITSRALLGVYYDKFGERLFFSVGFINFTINV